MNPIQIETDTPKRGNAIYCYGCYEFIEIPYWEKTVIENDGYIHIKMICLACNSEKVHVVISKELIK